MVAEQKTGFVREQIRANSSKNLLTKLARERLEKVRSKRYEVNSSSLLEFIPSVSPRMATYSPTPYYLAPFLDKLEAACEPGGLRIVFAAPPQHGKTEAALHGFLWLALKYPGMRHAYVTYGKERADAVSRQFQILADSIGLECEGRLSDVHLKGGTQIRFTSIGGSLTGCPVDGLLLIDDPVKDRSDAESPTIRRTAAEWFIDVARSRRHPKTSIICMATRWHPEDLSGELIASGYPYINLKAIAEGATDESGTVTSDPLLRKTGQSLFPEFKPPNFFQEERKDEYSWNSLYQGEPRGRGSYVFQWLDKGDQTNSYAPVPVSAYDRMCIGVDFAYTAKTHADYSVAVVIGAIGDTLHVVDVVRVQVETRHFRDRLLLLKAQYPIAKVCAYVAATEQGGVEFIREGGINITGLLAKQDKFMRAVPVAAAWNSRQFKLPLAAQWLDTFTAEICGFTGVSDKNDDQVDAFAAAFDGLGPKPSVWQPPILGGVDVEYRGIGMG
jgi:predicted phage terminase large subunit-like protein